MRQICRTRESLRIAGTTHEELTEHACARSPNEALPDSSHKTRATARCRAVPAPSRGNHSLRRRPLYPSVETSYRPRTNRRASSRECQGQRRPTRLLRSQTAAHTPRSASRDQAEQHQTRSPFAVSPDPSFGTCNQVFNGSEHLARFALIQCHWRSYVANGKCGAPYRCHLEGSPRLLAPNHLPSVSREDSVAHYCAARAATCTRLRALTSPARSSGNHLRDGRSSADVL
jgi:hypothetical protein